MSSGGNRATAAHRLAGPGYCILAASAFVVLSSCQNSGKTGGALVDRPPSTFDLHSGMQQGEVTVREGTEIEVRFPRAYQTPPKIVLVELRGAQALETYYSIEDLHIVNPTATSFHIRNDHAEHGGSWVTVKWRADGAIAGTAAAGLSTDANGLVKNDRSQQEVLIERIKNAGGKVAIDPNAPKDNDTATLVSTERDRTKDPKNAPLDVTLTSTVDPRLSKNSILSVDLHRTRVTDNDLTQLESLTHLRSLNLYGTKVTDAGMASISKLTDLQTLYLNNTGITDAGVQYLQGLKKLGELGLNQTRVTDQGLAYLRGLANLHSISLSDTSVTDQGIEQLKGLRNLKHLYVTHTKVSKTAIDALKKAIPGLQVAK